MVNSSHKRCFHPYMMCLVCPQVTRSCTGIWVTNRSPPSQKSRPVTRCPTAPQENANSSEGSTTSAAASALSTQTYTTAPPYPTRRPSLGNLQPNLPRDPPQNPHCWAAGSPDSSCSHTERLAAAAAARLQYYHFRSRTFHRTCWNSVGPVLKTSSVKRLLLYLGFFSIEDTTENSFSDKSGL